MRNIWKNSKCPITKPAFQLVQLLNPKCNDPNVGFQNKNLIWEINEWDENPIFHSKYFMIF